MCGASVACSISTSTQCLSGICKCYDKNYCYGLTDKCDSTYQKCMCGLKTACSSVTSNKCITGVCKC